MSEKRYDVVGLGVIAVDDMLYVPQYPPANAKVRITGRKRLGGGTMACALAAAAKLGSRCAALGRLGDNEPSQFVRQHLAPIGVDLSLLIHDPRYGPLHSTIVVASDTGSRAIYADYTTTKALEPDELKPEWFADAKVLFVDQFNPPAILAAAKLARQFGLQVVSDIESDSAEFSETRRYIDHLVCSAEFAVPYTQANSPEDACRALAGSGDHASVVVTAGDAGCYWSVRENSKVQHQAAHCIKAVDTTGCGDVFHGVFCHGVAAGWPMEHVIAWANAGAAIKATRVGGWLAVPTTTEIQQGVM